MVLFVSKAYYLCDQMKHLIIIIIIIINGWIQKLLMWWSTNHVLLNVIKIKFVN